MLFDRLEFGDEGLLSELWLGLTAGDGLVGNKLLMLNFPMGEDCGGNELTGLDIGGITLVEDEAVNMCGQGGSMSQNTTPYVTNPFFHKY